MTSFTELFQINSFTNKLIPISSVYFFFNNNEILFELLDILANKIRLGFTFLAIYTKYFNIDIGIYLIESINKPSKIKAKLDIYSVI